MKGKIKIKAKLTEKKKKKEPVKMPHGDGAIVSNAIIITVKKHGKK